MGDTARLALVGVTAVLTLAAWAPSRAEACACHFLACGGGGLAPLEPGEVTHRYWEADVRVVGQTLYVDRVTLRASRTPVRIRRGRGSFRVITRHDGMTRSTVSFDVPGHAAMLGSAPGRAALHATVRVPYDPEADLLLFEGPVRAPARWALAPAQDRAEAILVRRLARDLAP